MVPRFPFFGGGSLGLVGGAELRLARENGARNREGNPAVFGAGAGVTSILGEFTSSQTLALDFLSKPLKST